MNLHRAGVIESPIQGADGNREFLSLFERDAAVVAPLLLRITLAVTIASDFHYSIQAPTIRTVDSAMTTSSIRRVGTSRKATSAGRVADNLRRRRVVG